MLRIGPLEIANRVLLAPMSGVTDAPFRKLASEMGAGMVVSEMVASENLVNERAQEVRRTLGGNASGPKVIQLAGRETRWMSEGARIAQDLGADIIDINMGCPAKQVTKGASGAALMRDLDHASRLIEATVEAVGVPVTLKMRLGWDETTMTAPALAKRAQDIGVQMIAVHGRTRAQFFKGQADWRAIGTVKKAVTIPVIANGDLKTFDDCTRMLALSGADGVMVGRGAYGAPWFPGMLGNKLNRKPVPAMTPARQKTIVLEHYDAMLRHYGNDLGVRCARKHLAWYINTALGASGDDPNAKTWRAKICTRQNPGDVIEDLNRFYGELAQAQP